jgi:hypothetical protein
MPMNLRTWLDHLAACERLVLARPGVDLRFELAAIAKHFPRPGTSWRDALR